MPQLTDSQIVDTDGADDAFIGGFLAAFYLDKSLEDCIKAGSNLRVAVV
jgi:adenosine kinase